MMPNPIRSNFSHLYTLMWLMLLLGLVTRVSGAHRALRGPESIAQDIEAFHQDYGVLMGFAYALVVGVAGFGSYQYRLWVYERRNPFLQALTRELNLLRSEYVTVFGDSCSQGREGAHFVHYRNYVYRQLQTLTYCDSSTTRGLYEAVLGPQTLCVRPRILCGGAPDFIPQEDLRSMARHLATAMTADDGFTLTPTQWCDHYLLNESQLSDVGSRAMRQQVFARWLAAMVGEVSLRGKVHVHPPVIELPLPTVSSVSFNRVRLPQAPLPGPWDELINTRDVHIRMADDATIEWVRQSGGAIHLQDSVTLAALQDANDPIGIRPKPGALLSHSNQANMPVSWHIEVKLSSHDPDVQRSLLPPAETQMGSIALNWETLPPLGWLAEIQRIYQGYKIERLFPTASEPPTLHHAYQKLHLVDEREVNRVTSAVGLREATEPLSGAGNTRPFTAAAAAAAAAEEEAAEMDSGAAGGGGGEGAVSAAVDTHDIHLSETDHESVWISVTHPIGIDSMMPEASTMRVQVEGAPGVGKSTFLKHIAQMWADEALRPAEYDWLSRYDLVLYLPLHLLNKKLPHSGHVNVGDLWYAVFEEYGLFAGLSYDRAIEKWMRLMDYLESQGQSILYLLDSFDEAGLEHVDLRGRERHEPEAVVLRSLLNKPQVILASRPMRTLARNFDKQQRIRVMGLSAEAQQGFIQDCIREHRRDWGDTETAALCHLIEENPALQELATNPTVLESICWLYSRKGIDFLAENAGLTPLYRETVEELFNRWLADITIEGRLLSEEDHEILLGALKAYFVDVCYQARRRDDPLREMSYEYLRSIYETEKHKTLRDFNVSVKAIVERSGLLRISRHARTITAQQHQFIHLSYMEYFAALRRLEILIEAAPEEPSELQAYMKAFCEYIKTLPENAEWPVVIYSLSHDERTKSQQMMLYWFIEMMTSDLSIKPSDKIDQWDESYDDSMAWLKHISSDFLEALKPEAHLSKAQAAVWQYQAARHGESAFLHWVCQHPEIDFNTEIYDGMQIIHGAAQASDARLLQRLIAAGAKIDARDEDGRQPIHYAAMGGSKAGIQFLLDRGAKVDAKDLYSRQPIHYAAWEGSEACLRLLLDQGAKVDAKNKYDIQPIHWAAEGGSEACVRLLLDQGAKVDAKDKSGAQPIYSAARGGHEACVRLFLDRGIKVDAKTNFGKEPIHGAALSGSEACVRLLLGRRAKVDAEDSGGSQPIHFAAEGGSEACVQLLLERRARVDAKDEHNRQPIHFAAERGHVACVRLLLDCGANVDAKINDGSQPIHDAARSGSEACMRLLLAHGAKVDVIDYFQLRPIHHAAAIGREACVRLLLDRGAKVDAKDEHNRQPIHFAAMSGHEDCVRLLLDRGAKVDAKDGHNIQPIHVAAARGHEACMRLLLDRGANVDAKDGFSQPIRFAARDGNEACVQLLLDRGAKVDEAFKAEIERKFDITVDPESVLESEPGPSPG